MLAWFCRVNNCYLPQTEFVWLHNFVNTHTHTQTERWRNMLCGIYHLLKECTSGFVLGERFRFAALKLWLRHWHKDSLNGRKRGKEAVGRGETGIWSVIRMEFKEQGPNESVIQMFFVYVFYFLIHFPFCCNWILALEGFSSITKRKRKRGSEYSKELQGVCCKEE